MSLSIGAQEECRFLIRVPKPADAIWEDETQSSVYDTLTSCCVPPHFLYPPPQMLQQYLPPTPHIPQRASPGDWAVRMACMSLHVQHDSHKPRVASAAEELHCTFYSILLNLSFNFHNHTWSVATVLAGTAAERQTLSYLCVLACDITSAGTLSN